MSDYGEHSANEFGHHASLSESWLSRHAPYVLLLGYLYYCTQIATEILGEWFSLFEMLPIITIAINVLLVAAFAGVAIKVVGQMLRRASSTTILRTVLGEPTWWRTWYPRSLRARTSVWDELPLELKLMRTVLWLGLLLLPAGFFLVVFVIPTFQVVYENLGVRLPLLLRTYTSVVTAGGYLVPLIMVAALVELWRLRARYGLSRIVAFSALFSVDQDFWERTDARRLLTH
jgi:hypothetical protein